MNLLNFIGGLKSRAEAKTDLGILTVAFMVAALDGDVTDAEYETFQRMARASRGADDRTAEKALAAAMRSAGYLMLLARRVDKKVLPRLFIDEVAEVLPNSFATLPLDEVRRAFVTWIAMAMSDGDYSERERLCIEALCRYYAEIKVMKTDQDAQCASLSTSAVFSMAFGDGLAESAMDASGNFIARVEALVAEMGDSSDGAKKLQSLIDGDKSIQNGGAE